MASKFDLLKKLEYLVAFQAGCLSNNNWEAFDEAEREVKELERQVLEEKNN